MVNFFYVRGLLVYIAFKTIEMNVIVKKAFAKGMFQGVGGGR